MVRSSSGPTMERRKAEPPSAGIRSTAGASGIDDSVHEHVREALLLGKYRSLKQDLEFPMQPLVDMALQAIFVTTRTEAQRKAVRLHAEMVYRVGQKAVIEKKDRDGLEELVQGVIRKDNSALSRRGAL